MKSKNVMIHDKRLYSVHFYIPVMKRLGHN